MIPRFCKLCYQVVDESLLNLRRFSTKHVRASTEENYSSDCSDSDEEYDPKKHAMEFGGPPPETEKVWIIKCKKPEFNFYEGQIYPQFVPMPLASRGWHHRLSKGDYFTIYPRPSETQEEIDISTSFSDINLDERLLNNIQNCDFLHPTSIQKLGIPRILNGQNVILTAETGCGKTLAYLIPILQQILKWKQMAGRNFNSPLAVILTPSQELTKQIANEARKLSKDLDIKVGMLTGGRTKKIMQNPHVAEIDILVSTIGVLGKLVATKIYKLNHVKHIVFDEADTLFDDTFSDYSLRLLRKIPLRNEMESPETCPTTAQITLNSATIPHGLSQTLYKVINPDNIKIVTTGKEHNILVPQKFFRLSGSTKPITLLKIIKEKMRTKAPTIVFSNNTSSCDFTSIFLSQFNIKCINLHGGMSFKDRKGKFMEFQNGRCNILTTTDAGARGLDTTMAKDVINFDFPLITAEYIHRCGRIGRIGSPMGCKVINFISKPLEIVITSKIEYAIRKGKTIPMLNYIQKDFKEDEFIGGPDAFENDKKTTDLENMEDCGFKLPESADSQASQV